MALSIRNIALIGGGATAIAGGSAGVYLLSQDKTIEHRLIREGEKLIETDKEYLVAFKEHRSNTDFINLIKGTDNTISETGDVQKGKVALKTWCESSLKLSLTEENIQSSFKKAKKYCIKPPMTIGARIEKLGKKWVNDWGAKLDKLKAPKVDEGLAADLKLIDPKAENLENTEKKVVYDALEKWCKGNEAKDLADNTTDDIWKKVDRRCIEPV